MPDDTGPLTDDERDWLAHVAKELGATAEGFRVDDTRKAAWCLAMRARAEARKEATTRDYHAQLDALNAWRAQLDKEDDHTIERMDWLLEPYWQHLKAEGRVTKGKKSYPLPGGVIGERWQDTKWKRDDAALLPLAQALKLTKTTEAPDWAQIKPLLRVSQDGLRVVIRQPVWDTQTGEITEGETPVPGVTVERPAGHYFYTKTTPQASHESR